MLRVIFLRHGLTQSISLECPRDELRRLTSPGRQGVSAVATQLVKDRFSWDLALVSTAARTRQTYEIAQATKTLWHKNSISRSCLVQGEELSPAESVNAVPVKQIQNPGPEVYYSKDLYHGWCDEVIEQMRALPLSSGQTLLVVGHQMWISELAKLLVRGEERTQIPAHYVPATAVVLEFTTDVLNSDASAVAAGADNCSDLGDAAGRLLDLSKVIIPGAGRLAAVAVPPA